MPYLGRIRVSVQSYFRSVCLTKNDIDSYEGVLNFIKTVSDNFGVAALKFVQEIAFGDNDLNVSGILSILMRLILHKCDKTEVNLNETTTIKANKAIKLAAESLKS